MQEIADLQKMARNGDYDQARAEENRIIDDVLKEIAKGHPMSQGLAREVLRTKNIIFSRWYT